MSNLLRLAWITFLVGSSGASGKAADSPVPNVPAPKPPFIARAPEQSSWVIDITPTGTDSGVSSAKSLRAQLWTKSGTAMQCANEWSDGTQTEDTVVGPSKIAQSPYEKGVRLYNPKSNPQYHDFSTGDFEMLDWLTPQNYVGAVNHAGQPCYLFYTKGTGAMRATAQSHDLSLTEITTPATPMSVYVSVQTHLPVEIDGSSDKYAFQFGSPGQLKMPAIQPPAPPPPPAPTPPPPPKPKKKAAATTAKAVKKSDSTDKTNAPPATDL